MTGADVKQSSTAPDYGGLRILEAMNEAPRYAAAIENHILQVATSAGRILDFGAGDGLYAAKLRSRGLSVDCVELDPELRRQLAIAGHTVFDTLQSCTNETYDLIYSINVMEHIEEIAPIFSDMTRVLKPGGRVFIFVPAFQMLWTSLDTEVGHVRRFDKKLLSGEMAKAGLCVTQIRYFDLLGFPAALSVRLLETFNAFRYNAGSIGCYDRYVLPLSLALDRVFSPVMGKNLIAVGQKI